MPSITSTGLGSGLDIEGLVSKLVAAEGTTGVCAAGNQRG